MSARCCSSRKGRALAAGSVLPLALGVLLPKCPMCLPLYLAALSAVGASYELGAQLLAWARVPLFVLAVVLLGLAVRRACARTTSS